MIKKVEALQVGKRLDVFVQESLGMTRNAAQRAIANGDVNVFGKLAKANFRLSLGDEVALILPEPAVLEIIPQNIPLEIVYEDTDLAVVSKQKGLVVHPAPGHYEGTLVNALMFHLGSSLSGINGVMRPGIVHRIDKDTSGLLVVAKNDNAHNVLTAQFANHSITREYIAIVHGRPKPAHATIDAPLARHKTERKRMAIDPNGKKAITHYKTLEELGTFSLISATLETGRTHQIRIHMAHKGHPVLADPVYSKSKQTHGLAGQALHAQKLGFVHPNGSYIEFEAKPPECFARALAKLRS